jgi:hypothetical protein
VLRYKEEAGVSELGDVVRTTTYRNAPIRSCSKCPMLFIDVWNDGSGYCAMYGQQLVRGQTAPSWCRVTEVVVKEQFDDSEGTTL